MRHLIDAIHDEFAQLSFSDKVNRGGCGLFALRACHMLEAQGFEVYARVADYFVDGTVDLTVIRENIPEKANKNHWNNQGIYFSHVFVEVLSSDIYWFDSDYVQEPSRSFKNWEVVPGRLSQQDLYYIVRERYGWNSAFSRKQMLGHMRNAFHRALLCAT